MPTDLPTNEKSEIILIIQKLLRNEKLTSAQSLKAAARIAGIPPEQLAPLQGRRGRPGGSDAAIQDALFFAELRLECGSDLDCYNRILAYYSRHGGRAKVSVDSIRKSVDAGQKALNAPDFGALAKSLLSIYEKEILDRVKVEKK